MFRLLTFLSNFRNVILFIVLEAIAFNMVVRINEHQKRLMGDFFFDASSTLHAQIDKVNIYFNLLAENNSLMDENISLRAQLLLAQKKLGAFESLAQKDSLYSILGDSTESLDNYVFIPSRVLKNSTNKNYNYITLDKGSKDGVKIGMGVVSPQGIVGKVIRVVDDYCLVLSALNVSFRLTLKAVSPEGEEKVGNVGIYKWEGADPLHAYVTYIPETVTLATGYAIVTSEFSTIFPPGYKVGTISKIEKKTQDGFNRPQIELATDFNSLGNVYLVEFRDKAILDSLEVDIPK